MFLGLQLGLGPTRVSNAAVPANTAAPTITGVADVGEVLTVSSTGTWTNSPLSYTYQWNRSGAPIIGETNTTYTVTTSDQGYDITCTVRAINASGSGTASSNAISISAAPAAGTGSINLDEDGNPLGLVIF